MVDLDEEDDTPRPFVGDYYGDGGTYDDRDFPGLERDDEMADGGEDRDEEQSWDNEMEEGDEGEDEGQDEAKEEDLYVERVDMT